MHQAAGRHDLAAEVLHHALMAQANAEHGYPAGKVRDQVQRHARVRRPPGARRDAQVRGLQALGAGNVDGIVAVHHDVGVEHQKRLHQVVGEGVEVVDHQQADAHRPSSAISIARRRISLLAITSRYSNAGSLSATIPAPAWKLYSSS